MATKEVGAWRAAASAAGVSVSEFVRDQVNQSLMSVRKEPRLGQRGSRGGKKFFSAGWGLSNRRRLSQGDTIADVGVSRAVSGHGCVQRLPGSWRLRRRRACSLTASHESALKPLSGRPLSIRYPAGTRPRRGGVRSRQARLQLRLESSDLEAWQRAAAAAGVSLSGLVRRLMSGVVVNPGRFEQRPGSWRDPLHRSATSIGARNRCLPDRWRLAAQSLQRASAFARLPVCLGHGRRKIAANRIHCAAVATRG